MAAAGSDLGRALELACIKKKRLEEILSITQKQSKVLAADKAEQLLSYINDKQRLIDEINAIDREFAHVFHNIKEQMACTGHDNGTDNDHSENTLYMQLLDAMDIQKELINTVYAMEKENQKRVMSVIEGVKTKLSGINKGKRGYKAYRQLNQQTEGFFIDKRE